MNKVNLLPADTYIVKNGTVLTNEDRNILMKLYQPVIGATSINLYLTLWSDLDSLKIISKEYNHHYLMTQMRLKLSDIEESRDKLEAIGLLKTYLKKDTVNTYIYELYSPLSPKEFLDNPILSVTLENNIGKQIFKDIIKFFSLPKINKSDYEEITTSFNEVFEVTNVSDVIDTSDIRSVNHLDIVIDNKIDLNNVLASIPPEYLNPASISKEIKSLIYKLVFIYSLNKDEVEELIRNSINEKHMIDKDILRKNCKNYYTFENKGSNPSLIYKLQPEYLRKQATNISKKNKMIHTFETTTPYDFLSGKNKGVKPNKKDLELLETLMIDYELTPGIVNVLVDYVLKINDNKLTKNFCIAIATQWKRSNITTVEDAMNLCKKENVTKGKKISTNVKVKKQEEKPEWYGAKLEEDLATEEEIKALEEMLKR